MSWDRVDLSAPEFAGPSEPPVTLGLLYRGKRHALSGPPEAAKTLLALIAGLEHVRGGEGLFALVDFEMGERATRLLLAELGATDEEIANVYYVAPSRPPDADDVAAIVAAGVTLVIIDAAAGAYDASALDDNKRADAEKFSRAWVWPFWERGIATLLVDHVTKNVDGRGRYAIGSERKLGTVDVHLGLHAIRQLSRGGRGLIRVATHKDRPAHLHRPYALEVELVSDPVTHAITWTLAPASDETGDSWRPTVLMDRMLEYLSRNPEPITRTQLAKAVPGKRGYKFQAIDALLDDGKLREKSDRTLTLAPADSSQFPHRSQGFPGTEPLEGAGNGSRPSIQGTGNREPGGGLADAASRTSASASSCSRHCRSSETGAAS